MLKCFEKGYKEIGIKFHTKNYLIHYIKFLGKEVIELDFYVSLFGF